MTELIQNTELNLINTYFLDTRNESITTGLDLAKFIIESLVLSNPDQGDTALSYHLSVKAVLELANKPNSLVNLNGFIEKDPYNSSVIIYVNPELSSFDNEDVDSNSTQQDDHLYPYNVVEQICSKFNCFLKTLTTNQKKAISKAFDMKASGVQIQTYQPEITHVIGLIFALDSFMLDDSRDWFYFSEITIDNAYKALSKGIHSLIIDTDLKKSLQLLLTENNAIFTDLAILSILYPLLLKSEQNVELIQNCLSLLMNAEIAQQPMITVHEIVPSCFDTYIKIYSLLPHMKPILSLFNEIAIEGN